MIGQREIEDLVEQMRKSKGRLATLFVLVGKNDWQDCSAVYNESAKISHHGTNYVYELGRWHSIFEFSSDTKQIRIRPEHFKEVRASVLHIWEADPKR